MKRNSKVLSVIAAAVVALLAGCVTVPSGDLQRAKSPTCRSIVGRVRKK